VLLLSLHDYQIYEGNRHSLTELKLPPDTPENINEALGSNLTDKHTTVASYGGVGSQTGDMHHGHGGKSPEEDIDTEKFFRFVAKTINDNYSSSSGLPLILAALPEHQNLFHKVSDILSLLPSGIDVNPKSLKIDELVAHAWKVMEPHYHASIDKICDEYHQAKSKGTGSDSLSEVAAAAAAGRVDTLLIEAARQIPGKITNATGTIEKGELNNPEMDDLLDDLGELVTKMGGKVMIIPHEKMPTKTGAACLFRY
jgi:peptide subunit release factor 1 (eRF1)